MKIILTLLIGVVIGYQYASITIKPEIKTLIVEKQSPQPVKKLLVSAYALTKSQCDKDLKNTATMQAPVSGVTAAVSRDNLNLLGKQVYIEGYGVRTVSDVMHKRFKNKIDLLMSKQEAKKFNPVLAKVVIIN